MIVRKSRPEDAAAITEILNEIIAIGGTTAYQTPRSPDYFDVLISPGDPRVFMHVAETEGENGSEIAGFQWIRPYDPPEEHLGGIATFAKPGTTQRGIGSALFEVTKAACIAAGYTGMTAIIRADNTGGLSYYGKMGFVDHSVDKDVPLTDGTPVDRVRKDLMFI